MEDEIHFVCVCPRFLALHPELFATNAHILSALSEVFSCTIARLPLSLSKFKV